MPLLLLAGAGAGRAAARAAAAAAAGPGGEQALQLLGRLLKLVPAPCRRAGGCEPGGRQPMPLHQMLLSGAMTPPQQHTMGRAHVCPMHPASPKPKPHAPAPAQTAHLSLKDASRPLSDRLPERLRGLTTCPSSCMLLLTLPAPPPRCCLWRRPRRAAPTAPPRRRRRRRRPRPRWAAAPTPRRASPAAGAGCCRRRAAAPSGGCGARGGRRRPGAPAAAPGPKSLERRPPPRAAAVICTHQRAAASSCRCPAAPETAAGAAAAGRHGMGRVAGSSETRDGRRWRAMAAAAEAHRLLGPNLPHPPIAAAAAHAQAGRRGIAAGTAPHLQLQALETERALAAALRPLHDALQARRAGGGGRQYRHGVCCSQKGAGTAIFQLKHPIR